ncbi:DUF6468 domain-containing protein [Brevundimonas variabilis]|uniref:DUF6468 domain-containing protein n=1 Tax=Brevundimonas variabilis TaxID=74312 RepID=A0A7W9CKU0_9CAUL|nr:DUF6468 domain-containing protein [Brevundimonas variabilis]MBB5747540.1 hypothetical protein [Brevundimonas variabilis]
MTGIILDAILMLLLVAAIGYGIRLEKKLTQLRAGQLAFAGAVTELNTAAGRAENALASLRLSGEEADLLHDRIIKARALKIELEGLIARGPAPVVAAPQLANTEDDARANEVAAALLRRASAMPSRERESSMPPRPAAMTPVMQAMAANQAAQQSLNRARRRMDEDLFAA